MFTYAMIALAPAVVAAFVYVGCRLVVALAQNAANEIDQ